MISSPRLTMTSLLRRRCKPAKNPATGRPRTTQNRKQALHELSILEPRCLGLGASAEERKKRREEEKKALEDAITILESMAPAEAPEPSETEEFLQRRKGPEH